MVKSMNPYRVLSLDGGGIRGLYTASVLATLASRYCGGEGQTDIGKGFDLLVGTSTGGILATALAAAVPITDVISLYKDEGPKIFCDPIPNNVIKKAWWGIRNFQSPANPNQVLYSALESIFKDETVGQVYARRKIGLCLASVSVSTHKAKVFKTGHDPLKTADDARFLKDICLATSAAPIVLPIAGVPEPLNGGITAHYVDGGLWANNPILIALTEALVMSDEGQPIQIVSIGTCPPPGGVAINSQEAQRGVAKWGFGLKALDLSMDAQASGNQFIASFLAASLRKCGRNVEIIRLEQTAPSSQHAEFLSLDNPSDKACSTLMQLGSQDALEIYGKALRGEPQYQNLSSIFKSMPQLAAKESQK